MASYETGYLSWKNRLNVTNNLGDIPSQFLWEFQITRVPPVIYYPGRDVIIQRVISCTPPATGGINNVAEQLHGCIILQPGDVGRGGRFQAEIQDFEDLSITKMFQDWRDKIQDPETKATLPKAQLVMDMILYQLSKSGNPIKSWTMSTGLLSEPGLDGDAFGPATQNNGKLQIAIDFEHVVDKVLNEEA